MNRATAFALLQSLDLPAADYAVFGSGPLLVRGIIDDVGDLDVLARGAAWEQAAAAGELTVLPDEGITIAAFFDGAVTVGRSWALGEFDIDALIDTAELMEGIPFVRLEHVIAYKRATDRDKDRIHLAAIAQWRRGAH